MAGSKTGAVQTVMLCTLLCLMQVSCEKAKSSRNSHSPDDLRTRDLVGMGKSLHYLVAVIYDVVGAMMCGKAGCRDGYLQSLLEATKVIPASIRDRYPCSVFVVSGMENLEEFQDSEDGILYHNFFLDSKVCGKVSSSFAIAISQDVHVPVFTDSPFQGQYFNHIPWNWHIYANPEFKINVTFLYMRTSMASHCTTLQAMVIDSREVIDVDNNLLGVYCPDFPVMSYYSSQNVIHIVVRPAASYLALFYKSRYLYERYGIYSFEYQIHQNDFEIHMYLPHFAWYVLSKWHLLTYHNDIGVSYYTMLLGISVNEIPFKLQVFDPANLHEHRKNWLRIAAAFHTRRVLFYIFHLQAYLGDSLTMDPSTFPYKCCTGDKIEINVFDGPPVDMMDIGDLLPLLYTWRCHQLFDSLNDSNVSKELMSSIGDVTVTVLFGLSPIGNVSNHCMFSIPFHNVEPPAITSQAHSIRLKTNGSSSTMSFTMENTFMHLIAVHPPLGSFVQMAVQDIQYGGYYKAGCTFGGMFIARRKITHTDWPYHAYVGSICSLRKAEEFLYAYKQHGLPLGEGAFLVLKQYSRLSHIRAVLSFAIDICPGILNFVPTPIKLGVYYHEKIMLWKATKAYFANGSNSYYVWPKVGRIYHLSFNGTSHCFRISYFTPSHANPELEMSFEYSPYDHLHLYTTDHTSPALASVSYVVPDPTIQNLQDCFPDGFRLLADNRNDEPYIYLMAQDQVYSASAYNAKVQINWRCLLFGGTFHIKWEQNGMMADNCFTEIGGYMYDRNHPVIPQGLCGTVFVNLDPWMTRRLSLQSPLQHRRCCYYDFLIEIPQSECVSLVRVYQSVTHKVNRLGYVVQRWYMTSRGPALLSWRSKCRLMWQYDEANQSGIFTCMDMIVHTKAMCNMTLTYLASLIPIHLDDRSLTVEKTGSWKRLCLPNACYSVPVRPGYWSWMDAQELCESIDSNLASINTEEDWKTISRNGLISGNDINSTLLPVLGIQICYIGYRTEVSCGGVHVLFEEG